MSTEYDKLENKVIDAITDAITSAASKNFPDIEIMIKNLEGEKEDLESQVNALKEEVKELERQLYEYVAYGCVV